MLDTIIGGDPEELGTIDGQNMWDVLNSGSPSPKTEILHNIDDVRNVSALRSGDFKIVLGMFEIVWDTFN